MKAKWDFHLPSQKGSKAKEPKQNHKNIFIFIIILCFEKSFPLMCKPLVTKKKIFEQKEAIFWPSWTARNEGLERLISTLARLQWRGFTRNTECVPPERRRKEPTSEGEKTAWELSESRKRLAKIYSYCSWLPVFCLCSYLELRQAGITELWWIQWHRYKCSDMRRRYILVLGVW